VKSWRARKRPITYVAALLIANSAIACTNSATNQSASPTSGGSLVATLRAEPRSFNRFAVSQAAVGVITLLTHATLVRVNRVTGALEPRLAREWASSPDGLTWTFKLRDNVTFSDAVPFTAADVVFTFEALYDPRAASAMASGFQIDGKPLTARAIDDHTVAIAFPAPYGPGISILDSLPIFPKHTLANALADGTFQKAWGVETPPAEITGLGPFVLTQYVPGQRVTFSRNPHFWLKDDRGQPLPHLDQIELQIVPEQNAEVLRLESGAIDLSYEDARPEDIGALKKLESAGDLHVVEAGIGIDPSGLWFNLSPSAPAAKSKPWLQKEQLRHAISLAVDRQAVVDTVYLGAAVPVFGPITPGHGPWYVATLAHEGHDLARARQLLAEIGLKDRNGDGMLEDAANHEARFALVTQKGHTIREKTAALLQSQLKQVGLGVDVVALEFTAVVASINKADYEAAYFGVSADSFDPARNADFWFSSGSFHFWNPGQPKPASEWEAKIDDLMRQQTASRDPETRRQLFAQVQQTMAEHLPIVYFAAPKVTVAMNARVHGATPSVLRPPILWNAEALSVTAPAGLASRR